MKREKTAVVESEAVGLERVKEAEQLGSHTGPNSNLVEKLVKSSPVPEEIIIERMAG